MKNISYMTLAAVRNRDPIESDRVISTAVLEAGAAVGAVIVFDALCHQRPDEVVKHHKAA